MIRLFQRQLVAFLASLAISLPAAATSYSIDYTDLWWSGEAESGWGINFIQQHEIIFATIFHYGPDNTAHWYSASGMAPVGGSTSIFSGELTESRGPWFGAPWNPALVSRTQVGTMTVSFSGPNNGTLQYSVNGVQVTKQITRVTWRNNQLAGIYIGGMVGRGASCGQVATFDNLSIQQSGTQVTMRVDYFQGGTGTPAACTYTGNLVAQGRLSAINNGTYLCTLNGVNANNGTFSITAMDIGLNGFHGTYSGQDQFCQVTGRFGGVRDVP